MAENMKNIKLRIKSVESTMHITKAMELVAASKLRKAQERTSQSRPYFEELYNTLSDIAASNTEFSSPYLAEREVKAVCFIVIAGDRGLAGGYNNNILKLVYSKMEQMRDEGKNVYVFPVGKKAIEFFRRRPFEIYSTAYPSVEDITIGDCFTMAKFLSQGFLDNKFDEIYIGYTNFVSVLTQNPSILKMLPLTGSVKTETEPDSKELKQITIYEPSSTEVFDAIVPEYIGGLTYGALCESAASELAARRTAMDSATKNAEEMIDSLNLRYNRVRQSAITQEITEIISGSEN